MRTPKNTQPSLFVTTEERENRAVCLLRAHEPIDGYYLAFSGGKDSCVTKRLLQVAGVRFDAWYMNTTIDPPELIRFIKRFHPDVRWEWPIHGNMFARIATAPKVPPTRQVRWCCQEYKESGTRGRLKVFGVRAAESPKRRRWHEVSEDINGDKVLCPIVYWTDDDVWEYIHARKIPYCDLYDQGISRIGCVGCPLAGYEKQSLEFLRWPKYAAAWHRAVVQNWERWYAIPRDDGEPRFQGRFKSGEEFWQWWRNEKKPDIFRDCQSGLLWTNETEGEL
jgi:phosphoadenosine phosphosulfate reductase